MEKKKIGKTEHMLKITIFCDVAPYFLIEFYQRFRGTCRLYVHCVAAQKFTQHLERLPSISEKYIPSKVLVNFYPATRHQFPDAGRPYLNKEQLLSKYAVKYCGKRNSASV
jgi:hypothetical protein